MELTTNDMIYFSGYTAGEMGLTIDDNPYQEGSEDYQDWRDGYKVWMSSFLRMF